jgi:hypothetical protein
MNLPTRVLLCIALLCSSLVPRTKFQPGDFYHVID